MGSYELLSLSDDHIVHEKVYHRIRESFGNELELILEEKRKDKLLAHLQDKHIAVAMIDELDKEVLDSLEHHFPHVPVLLITNDPELTIPSSIDPERIDALLHGESDKTQLYFTLRALLDTFRHSLELRLLLNEKKNRTADIIRERKKMLQEFREQMALLFNENRELKKQLAASQKEEAAHKEVQKEKEKLKRANQHLYQQIKTLTNQISLKNILNIEIERSKRKKRDLTLLILGIDQFSDFETEDSDAAREIGTRFKAMLSSNLRITDFISHTTHGHYNVIMTETDSNGAKQFVKRFNEQVLSSCTAPNDTKLMVSYGITSFMQEDTVEGMIKRAESALLKAQNNGKVNIVCLPEI